MFSSQSKSHVLQIKSQLSREKKGDQSASAYYTKMKSLADEMAAADKKFEDDDIVDYILNGLDVDYNPFVSSMSVKDHVTFSDLYGQLLSFEARLLQQNQDGGHFYSSANVASRGRGRDEVVVEVLVVVHPLLVEVHLRHVVVLAALKILLIKMMDLCVNSANATAIPSITVGFISTGSLFLLVLVLVAPGLLLPKSQPLLLLPHIGSTPIGILILVPRIILPMS